MENKKMKVLLIEDSIDDAALIKRKLEKSAGSKFQVAVARKLNDGLEQAQKNEPDLILSDLGLPDSHGLDTVTKILLTVPHIPLVVLSGFDDEDIAIKAVQSGAQDYLVKGQLDNTQWERSLFYSIERARLQDELEKNTWEISKLHVNLLKILDNSTDAIIVVSEEKRILFTNPAVASLFGRKPKEMLNLPFQYPLDVGKTYEIVIHRADEKTTTAEMSAVNISWEGKPAYLVSMHDITERKAMEEALRSSEEKYRTIVEMAQDSIITINLQGQITSCNEALARLGGTPAKEIVGKHFSEIPFLIPKDIASYTKIFTSLLSGERISPMEITWHHRDGTTRVIELRASLMKPNDKVVGIQAMIIDITERKTMENLQQAENLVLTLLGRGAELSKILDAIIRMCEQNDPSIKGSIMLYDASKNWLNGSGPSLTEEYNIVLKTGIPVMDNVGSCGTAAYRRERVVVPDIENSPFFKPNQEAVANAIKNKLYACWSEPIISSDGNLLGTIANYSDHVGEPTFNNIRVLEWSARVAAIAIERKQMEKALKDSEEKFFKAFMNSPQAIVITNLDNGVILEANDTFLQLTGYSREDLIGKKAIELNLWNSPEERKDIIKTLNEKGIVKNRERQFRKKSGDMHTWLFSAEIVNIDGKPCMLSVTVDITERKKMEDALQKIDRMKSEFLSNVSHELRTPLQSISGFTKLIMTGKVPDPTTQQEFLQIIDREAAHLGNLINSLLDMSRLEASKFQIYKKPTPVYDIFTDSIKMFHSLAREKDITLNETIPARLPKMEVDSERMRQVIINLLSNAIKFSNPGSSVNVRVAVRDNELLFQVIDHGTGIREEAMTHLFERFYRPEGEKARGGTGLGLYISKQIIDAHGGRIWAESKFGEGSTFSFTLPLNNKGGKKNGKENSGNRRRSGNAKTGRLLSKARRVPSNHRV